MKTNAEKCHIVIAKRTAFLNIEGLIVKNRNKEKLSGITTDTKKHLQSFARKLSKPKLRSTCKSCKLYTRFSILKIFVICLFIIYLDTLQQGIKKPYKRNTRISTKVTLSR